MLYFRKLQSFYLDHRQSHLHAINYLISKNYPKEHIFIEPIIKKFGKSGRNSINLKLMKKLSMKSAH